MDYGWVPNRSFYLPGELTSEYLKVASPLYNQWQPDFEGPQEGVTSDPSYDPNSPDYDSFEGDGFGDDVPGGGA